MHAELTHPETPDPVRAWAHALPTWVQVRDQADVVDPDTDSIDPGERAAIELASSIGVDVLLMDDRAGVRLARSRGFRVIGTLRLLALGARQGIVHLPAAIEQLKETNFRYRQELLDELLR